MTGKILDRQFEDDICTSVTEMLEAEGHTPEEIIPGLVKAVIEQAVLTEDSAQVLNEVSVLLEEE